MLPFPYGNCGMAEQIVRTPDRIDAAPRYSETDAIRLNHMFRGRDTVEMLEILLKENMLGDVAIVSSFGAESAILLHLIASIDPTVPVLFLDTGKHFPETITYKEELRQQLGLQDLRDLKPDADLLQQKDGNGLRWSYDPDGCCEIRKVLPLKQALAGLTRSSPVARHSNPRRAARCPVSRSKMAD